MTDALSRVEILIVPTSSRALELAEELRMTLGRADLGVTIEPLPTRDCRSGPHWCVILMTSAVSPTKSGLEARMRVIVVLPPQRRSLSSVVERIRRLA